MPLQGTEARVVVVGGTALTFNSGWGCAKNHLVLDRAAMEGRLAATAIKKGTTTTGANWAALTSLSFSSQNPHSADGLTAHDTPHFEVTIERCLPSQPSG